MSSLTKWVILAYLDGNSELAPEMAAAKADMEKVNYGENLQVLLQIGLIDEAARSILRPGIQTEEYGSGVRRYHLSQAGCRPAEELGDVNMADPVCLYEFIRWGMETCPAEHYALILGGHSCEYIGMLNDYTQNRPYIMGIPELSRVFDAIRKNTGRSLDLLIFDTCLFNNLEVLYELGDEDPPAIKTVLTYRKDAPAAGLPYRELITAAAEIGGEDSIDRLIGRLAQAASVELAAYRIDPVTLERVKRGYDTLARRCLEGLAKAAPEKGAELAAYLKEAQAGPVCEARKELVRYESSLRIPIESEADMQEPKLLALDRFLPYLDTAALYYRLAFARNNAWSDLLCSRLPESAFRFVVTIGCTPLCLPEEKVIALIASSNPEQSRDAVSARFRALAALKKWRLADGAFAADP